MATNILMPALSPTMTEGKLAKWLKKEGEQVRAGDVIAEIETDKATMEVEAVDEGVLSKIMVPEGTEGVQVNAVIAVLNGEGGEAAAAPAPKAEPPKAEPPKAEAPKAAPAAAPSPAAPKGFDPQPDPPKTNGAGGDRVFASPLARRMAQQAGIDLASLKGSGPGGRIVKADIDAARSGGAKPAPAAAAAPA
uniref:biotin/lipoyl-containing protein n=1 Tax=Elioraea rosea TaxID=2492390 RepID=UPI00118690F5